MHHVDIGDSGRYDDQFISYTVRMLQKCKEYGFLVFIDPHQDLVRRNLPLSHGCII